MARTTMSISSEQFYVLDYSTSRIIKNLDTGALLVVLRVLMQLPNPSFDVLNTSTKKICTSSFAQNPDGTWGVCDVAVDERGREF